MKKIRCFQVADIYEYNLMQILDRIYSDQLNMKSSYWKLFFRVVSEYSGSSGSNLVHTY